MFGHDHPAAFGPQHPWHDPLAPQDIFNPRPDADLAMAGQFAPRPEDFPFTDEGRRDYYAAVRSGAQQMQMQQMHAVRMREEEAAALSETARKRRAGFLLLLP